MKTKMFPFGKLAISCNQGLVQMPLRLRHFLFQST